MRKKSNIEKLVPGFTYWVLFSSAFIILLTIWAYSSNGYINQNLQLDTEKLGHFGDFIGGFAGFLLTFLATILIYFTYTNQKIELKRNKELFRSQQFENTFFNMLKVHQDIKHSINYDFNKNGLALKLFNRDSLYGKKTLKGKHFFIGLSGLFTDFWKYDDYNKFGIINSIDEKHKEYDYKYAPYNSVEKHLKDVLFKYEIFWDLFTNYLGDYFRNIYHILEYISDEKLKEINSTNNKNNRAEVSNRYKKYADILQSQMSYSELFFMFYNAQEYTNVKQYIKEFNFVENLTVERLLHPKHAQFEGMGKIKTEINI